MDFAGVERVYFIGIGGIGMSALARYFKKLDKFVAGYDRTQTPLTLQLEKEGIDIHYSDNINSIPVQFRENKKGTLIVFTPAVPADHMEYQFFIQNGYEIVKRAQALGVVAKTKKVVAIAGTHGKTSTTSMLAYLLSSSRGGCDAFLGGVSKNFGSNLVLADRGSNLLVVEADEFDRSFLQLHPHLAIITSVDADHLDIYETHEKVLDAYKAFASQIEEGGFLVIKKNLELKPILRTGVQTFTYSIADEADFCLTDLKISNGHYLIAVKTPEGVISNLSLGIPGLYNVENALAVIAAAFILGVSNDELRSGLEGFNGVTRRFDVRFRGSKTIYIDDYAHHPEEIKATINSVRAFYPGRKITGIFQPHLYSRTRDFAPEFAKSLDLLDQVILLDIYPAREKPIPGINSGLILSLMKNQNKQLLSNNQMLEFIWRNDNDILLTMGAGDIDKQVVNIVKILSERGL